jgi:hypothetical protein
MPQNIIWSLFVKMYLIHKQSERGHRQDDWLMNYCSLHDTEEISPDELDSIYRELMTE